MSKAVDIVLSNPVSFELQQRLCNNYQVVRSEFRDYLDTSGQRVLDVGCSTGTCADQIVEMSTNQYVGLDINPAYVARASRRYPDGEFFAMDARRMDFDTASFDVALFIGVLHHMDDATARDCLAEVKRVLRPNGRVLIAEPVFAANRALSSLLLRLDRGANIRIPAGYRDLLRGFRVERERFFDFSLHQFCSFVLTPAPD